MVYRFEQTKLPDDQYLLIAQERRGSCFYHGQGIQAWVAVYRARYADDPAPAKGALDRH